MIEKPEKNIIGIKRIAWGANGSLMDQFIRFESNEIRYSLGVVNSYLYMFSLFPFFSIIIEYINLIISLLRLDISPNLTDKESGVFESLDISKITKIQIIERASYTKRIDKISYFFPLLSLFMARFFRYKVIIKYSNKKESFCFLEKSEFEKFKSALTLRNLNVEQKEINNFLDGAFSYLFFSFQMYFLYVILNTLGKYLDGYILYEENPEKFTVIFIAFLLPLALKIINPALKWRNNYRYAHLN